MRWVGRKKEKPEEKRIVVPQKECYKICALLAFYLSMFWDNLLVPSSRVSQSKKKIAEEHRSHLHHSGSLNSCRILFS